MDDALRRPFLGEDLRRLEIGVAGVDDERQAGLARRPAMGAEQRLLPRPRAVLIIEIEPGLADPHHLLMLRQRNEPGDAWVRLGRRLVRMDADRAPHIAVALGDGAHPRKLAELGADGEQRLDAGPPRACQDLAALLRRRIIEMAMAVDQHHAGSVASTKRGKMPSGLGSAVPGASDVASAAKSRRSAGTASWSRSFAAAAGTTGCTRMARWRITSANT